MTNHSMPYSGFEVVLSYFASPTAMPMKATNHATKEMTKVTRSSGDRSTTPKFMPLATMAATGVVGCGWARWVST